MVRLGSDFFLFKKKILNLDKIFFLLKKKFSELIFFTDFQVYNCTNISQTAAVVNGPNSVNNNVI